MQAEIFGNIIPQVILDLFIKYKITIIQQSTPEQVNKITNFYNSKKISHMLCHF